MKKLYLVLILSLFVLGGCGLNTTNDTSVNSDQTNVNTSSDVNVDSETATTKGPSFYVTGAGEVSVDSWNVMINSSEWSVNISSDGMEVSSDSWSLNIDANGMQINGSNWAQVNTNWIETTISTDGTSMSAWSGNMNISTSWSTNVNDIIDMKSLIWE